MRNLRASIRALMLIAITMLTALMILVRAVLLRPFPRARWAVRNFIFSGWSKAAAAILRIRVTSQGTPPRGGFFLVSNHLSYLDIAMYATLVDAVFVAKSDVAHWPLIGWMCRSMGTIFVVRERRQDVARVGEQIEQTLNEGHGVLLFPEGTSTRGAAVLPFKPSLLEQAARAGFAVSHAAIRYRVPEGEPPAYLSVCWWDDSTFMEHVFGLMKIRRIEAEIVFGAETISAPDRKTLAARLHSAVESEFIPVAQPEAEYKPSIE
jgi:1-acyl-sn-glycerol-3-phosphate acyltransferase